MEIKVEKGIPIPSRGRTRGFTQALRNLKNVGDSVFLPTRIRGIYVAAKDAGLGGKITARTVEDGVRVWRIKK